MDSKELVNDWDVAALAATAHLVGMNNDNEEKDEESMKMEGTEGVVDAVEEDIRGYSDTKPDENGDTDVNIGDDEDNNAEDDAMVAKDDQDGANNKDNQDNHDILEEKEEDDSSSSSDSDSEADLDFAKEVAALEAMSEVVDDDDLPPSEVEPKVFLRTANEVAEVEPLYPLTKEGLTEVSKSAVAELKLVGVLMGTMLEDRLVVVRSKGTPVNEGTVLAVRKSDVKVWKEGCEERGRFGEVITLGTVGEVFGPVSGCMYKVDLQSTEGPKTEIEGDEIELPDGDDEPQPELFADLESPGSVLLLSNPSLPVYSVPSLTSSLSVNEIRERSGKGCDAR
jgi:hypothetical protein